MKKLTGLFLSLFLFTNAFAASFDNIVFLGDSLSDNGNLYKLLLTIVPKSPPYYQGRFSNGPTWAEHVGNHYSLKNNSHYKIYALGGATSYLHKPSLKFIAPTTLELELDNYLIDTLFKDKKKTLFFIWIGANDYLFDGTNDLDGMVTKVVNEISHTINTLINYGARNFVVLNLPDLSRTPFAETNQIVPRLQLLTQLHNQKLAEKITELQKEFPAAKIDFLNIYATMTDFIDHPDQYNQKYHVNIRDTANACWKGGYVFQKEALEAILNKEVAIATENNNGKNADSDAIRNFILNSPEINYIYSKTQGVGKGMIPCIDADEHLFWDEMHPTEVIHRVLSEVIIENVELNFA